MRLFSLPLLAAAALLASNSLSHAQNPNRRFFELQLGQCPPLIVATAATGPWVTKRPFDAATYGLTRGYAPSGASPEPGVVVYARTLDSHVAALVARLESLIETTGGLDGSFVNVFDAKGAQRGGYTADEVVGRLAELKKFADDKKLTRLPIGLAASPSAAGYVGLDETHNVTVVFLTRNSDPKKLATIAWKRSFDSKDLSEAAISELETELRGIVAKP